MGVRKYGGWETLVENIIKFLNKDLRIIVFCSLKSYKDKLLKYKGVELCISTQNMVFKVYSMMLLLLLSN